MVKLSNFNRVTWVIDIRFLHTEMELTIARMAWGIFGVGLDYEHMQITAAGIQSKENHLLQNILIYDREHGRIEKLYIVCKLGSIWEIFLTTEA